MLTRMIEKLKWLASKGFGCLLIGLLLSAGLYYSYFPAQKSLTHPNTIFFDFKKSPTWRESNPIWGGPPWVIMRIPVNKRLDSTLMSKKKWKNFDLQFSVHNPRNCAIAFNVEDRMHFDFLYLNFAKETVSWGKYQDGKFVPVEKSKVKLEIDQTFKLSVGNNRAQLFLDDELVSETYETTVLGKIGLVLEDISVPRTEFRIDYVKGTAEDGRVEKIKSLRKGWFNLSWPVVKLYLFFTSIVYYGFFILLSLRNLFPRGNREDQKDVSFISHPVAFIEKKFVRKKAKDKIFVLGGLILGALMFSSVFEMLFQFKARNIYNSDVWNNFYVSAGVYSGFLVLAILYRKYFSFVSTAMWFISFLFGFYLFSLINSLVGILDDTTFLRSCLAVCVLIVLIKAIISRKKKKEPKTYVYGSFGLYLIAMWFVYVFIYYFLYNLDIYRFPYSDEGNLWFYAAKNMIDGNLWEASRVHYPGGGAHSFGVPFVAALPALVAGTSNNISIFFMPLTVIITLCIFLCSLKHEKWCLLFMLCALYCTFHYNWLGQIVYRSLYGLGICMVYFLMSTREVYRMAEEKYFKPIVYLLLCGSFGLMALTKSPTGYFGIIFTLILAFIYIVKNKTQTARYFISLLGIMISTIPFFVWKYFSFKNHGLTNRAQYEFRTLHLSDPNTTMLSDAFRYIITIFPEAIIFTFLSILLIMIARKRGSFLALIPIVLLIVVVTLYYGFIYIGGDHESSIRYFMPQMMALFYLGGSAFQHLLTSVKE